MPSKPDDKHKLGVMIAIGGSGRKGAPPPPSPFADDTSSPDATGNDHPITNAAHDAAGGKVSRDEAGYIPMEQVCGACSNYAPATSECAVVEGTFRAGDTCEHYFVPADQNYLSIRPTPTPNEADESDGDPNAPQSPQTPGPSQGGGPAEPGLYS
jgi:hypothetical protein